jgi:hypothetical protein
MDNSAAAGPVAPDTFIRGSDPKAHPHYYCDLAGLAALFAFSTATGGSKPVASNLHLTTGIREA